MVAILEARNHSDVIVEYSVIIARVQKAGLVFGKPQPAREKYASNEDFGSRGWSLPTRELAEQWAQIGWRTSRNLRKLDCHGQN